MDAALDKLLSRYLEAANTIAHTSVPGLELPDPSDPRPGDEPHHPDKDPQARAVDELLRRQAGLLVQMHKAAATLKADQCRDDPQTAQAARRLLQRRLDDVASMAMTRFYSCRFDRVPYHWRCLYTDVLILVTHLHALTSLRAHGQLDHGTLDLIVDRLDRALITTGGVGRLGAPWIEKTLTLLEEACIRRDEAEQQSRWTETASTFSDHEPYQRPPLSSDPDRTCPRYRGWTLDMFERYMNDSPDGPKPVVFTDLIDDWPALKQRPWRQPDYLLSRTIGGRRLVPVEVGRSYVDDGWGQELIQFRHFLDKYVRRCSSTESPPHEGAPSEQARGEGQGQGQGRGQVGYLAQHDLFRQIPSLRNDISIPDLCWSAVPPHPTTPSKNQRPVEEPQLNAWFGPAKTITPLHNDGYHGLLVQVVGTKYVRLYPPQAPAECMRPRPAENGVDMSNTSELDVGVLEGWDEPPAAMSAATVAGMKRRLDGVAYRECVLSPGDALVIPIGWWHYVRSLSVSFSVSFWWN
ncbi:uncharacterized protein DCS_00666 [Drechmeria coniospora]|uniref:JmjC domain-containing protein n=1 Tax=Drechmeria coniospora TaxID=98403 RepID=A0A151GR08_DRECN|nr:uncharacterized protein DCS_00666 [Drechmeria coniospora]KYK59536.1 uncharacterized protein DCS_00666 [Drechmeria coniospora]